MAVTITSKFYQDSAWKDISKIVFTSPNLDSPATAGTRSHILPGQGNLGLWFEDSSQMFRIESSQQTTSSDFLNYSVQCSEDTDLSAAVGYILTKNSSYLELDSYVRNLTNVLATGYKDVTHLISNRTATKIEYVDTLDQINIISDGTDSFTRVTDINTNSCLYPDSSLGEYITSIVEQTKSYGWIGTGTSGDSVVFEFTQPVRIVKYTVGPVLSVNTNTITYTGASCTNFGTPSEDSSNTSYYPASHYIEGSNNGTDWTTLYTYSGDGTSFTGTTFTNINSYTYYRVRVNNTSMGMRSLRFFTNDYSALPGTTNIAVQELDNLDNPKTLKINNAYFQSSTTSSGILTETDVNMEGKAILTTTASGTTYDIRVSSVSDSYDYRIEAVCEAATPSGTGTDASASMYTKSDKINAVASAQASFSGDTLLFTVTDSFSDTIDDDPNWEGSAVISYTTTMSGTIKPGSDAYILSGTTSKSHNATLYDRHGTLRLDIDEYTTSSGIISEDSYLYIWGYDSSSTLDMDTNNSIIFEVTNGEAYNCRLTAWDDVTHSTILNELIQGDHVRCSAIAYCGKNDKLDPTATTGTDPINVVRGPVHNRIFKGNTIVGDTPYYYGDFDMVYRYQSDIYGDYLMFKPMLYGIDSGISYGVHDYVITLHYSYT